MLCRFCLDNRSTRKNPFLSPCSCRGSVEVVHFICLQKWRITNPPLTLNTCPLCKAAYTLPDEFQGEEIPIIRPEHFLSCPELYSFALFYVFCAHVSWFGLATFEESRVNTLTVYYLVGLETLFLGLCKKYWKVRAIQQYREEWSKRGGSIVLWFHLLIWLSWPALQNKTPLLLLPYSMRCIWKTHTEILQKRNEELLLMLPRQRLQ